MIKIPGFRLARKLDRRHNYIGTLVVAETMAAHQIMIILLGTKRHLSSHDVVVCGCAEQLTRGELAQHQAEQICKELMDQGFSIQQD